MYNFAKTLTNSCSSASLHAFKAIQKHASGLSRANLLQRKLSLPSLPLFSIGNFICNALRRGISQFSIHPEKLKQIIKVNESQTLCNFFGSREYQKHLQAVVENQKKILCENSPLGVPESEIKYEHVISCAQPMKVTNREVKRKMQKQQAEEQVISLLDERKKKTKPAKTTVMSIMLKKKKREEVLATKDHSTIMPLVMQTKMRNMEIKKKFRRRTTILPIFLQKMEENKKAVRYKPSEKSLNGYLKMMKSTPQIKRKPETENCKRTDYENESYAENEDVIEINEEPLEDENAIGGPSIARNLAYETSAYPNRIYRNSYNPNPPDTRIIIDPSQFQGVSKRHSSSDGNFRHSDNIEDCITTKNTKTPSWEKLARKWKKHYPRQKFKKHEISQSCQMNMLLNAQYEIDPSFADIIDVSSISKNSISSPNQATNFPCTDVFTLFQRVKSGSKKTPLTFNDDNKYSKRPISVLNGRPNLAPIQSLTHQIVCDNKEKKEQELKDRETCFPSVDVPSKSFEPIDTKLRYLFRLPKTTPEGYRILLYAVKDNDPTKMIFSDGIKAFCMFNDIILSEDGLQEGYIVVFDMKGVQLGHLARVNLTALRCFMIYIQVSFHLAKITVANVNFVL
ncbi:hypothetical protein JTB14_011944 [Gonioctena quinquepunctata]|nr:hypothetical protein JTB14_011944 [Gonioctena quinquepunctata]